MKKNKREKKGKLQYIVRVTTHRHLKGDKIPFAERRKPEKKKLKGGIYRTVYNEGDVQRTTKVKYFKDQKSIRAYMEKVVKKFKKSKQNDISATAQIIQGKLKSRYKGELDKKQAFSVSKPARLYSKTRKATKTTLRNAVVRLDRELSNVELLEYPKIPKSAKKTERVRKGKKIMSVKQVKKSKRARSVMLELAKELEAARIKKEAKKKGRKRK